MARSNIYLPDDLAAAARREGLNVSAIAQDAIRSALDRRATNAWLDGLERGPGAVSRADTLAALDAARDELGG